MSSALGHSSIAITADVYAHVTPELRDEAAAALDRCARRRVVKGKPVLGRKVTREKSATLTTGRHRPSPGLPHHRALGGDAQPPMDSMTSHCRKSPTGMKRAATWRTILHRPSRSAVLGSKEPANTTWSWTFTRRRTSCDFLWFGLRTVDVLRADRTTAEQPRRPGGAIIGALSRTNSMAGFEPVTALARHCR